VSTFSRQSAALRGPMSDHVFMYKNILISINALIAIDATATGMTR
jgi:hypothetical protein